MTTPSKYRVTGVFQGKSVDIKVEAFSEKQAKLRASMKSKIPMKEVKKASKYLSANKIS